MSELASTEVISEPVENVESTTTPEALEQGSAAETPEEKPKGNKVQERINQLTREKYEQRTKNQELEARLKELEARKVEPVKQELAAPKEDEYDDYSDYQTAQADYIAETATNRAYERMATEQQARVDSSNEQTRQETLHSKKKAFDQNVDTKRANFENFEDVAYGHDFMDTDLAEQIFDMDKGPEVAYHLGAHLDEAERIYALTPVQRARELTKLEYQVQALTPKKVSDAPDPIEPLGGSEAKEIDPDSLSADEWQKWRIKQIDDRNR